ncbi:hypothetical protein ZIOFF_002017 [Zingiber officinale]|uniref:Uncharacterized protein n=1 Tax=Zingiber officinale TaxID=94328 RepID=A0A8J5LSL7_ZINOF|nr:hypothetical protein ZIOFF_002017 [Zingiber officinale]
MRLLHFLVAAEARESIPPTSEQTPPHYPPPPDHHRRRQKGSTRSWRRRRGDVKNHVQTAAFLCLPQPPSTESAVAWPIRQPQGTCSPRCPSACRTQRWRQRQRRRWPAMASWRRTTSQRPEYPSPLDASSHPTRPWKVFIKNNTKIGHYRTVWHQGDLVNNLGTIARSGTKEKSVARQEQQPRALPSPKGVSFGRGCLPISILNPTCEKDHLWLISRLVLACAVLMHVRYTKGSMGCKSLFCPSTECPRLQTHVVRQEEKEGSKLPSNPEEVEDLRRDTAVNALIAFIFSELKLITGNFRQDHVLGVGGFGRVYKGLISEDLRDGLQPLQVAVKVHDGDNSHQG